MLIVQVCIFSWLMYIYRNKLKSVYFGRQFDIYPQNYTHMQPATTMQVIRIDKIDLPNNYMPFLSTIPVKIQFTLNKILQRGLVWKIIYVGSAKSQSFDQVLEEFQTPVASQIGPMKFQLQCSAPDHTKIPSDELVSITALIVSVSYMGQQAMRVGYYVVNKTLNNGRQLSEQQRRLMAVDELVQKTRRLILLSKPRITKFQINWREEKHGSVILQRQEESSLSNTVSGSMRVRVGEKSRHSKNIKRKEQKYQGHNKKGARRIKQHK